MTVGLSWFPNTLFDPHFTVLQNTTQVEEDDHVWEPDILFTDVASELTIEAEASEAENADDGAP